jgi:hypothetical protein
VPRFYCLVVSGNCDQVSLHDRLFMADCLVYFEVTVDGRDVVLSVSRYNLSHRVKQRFPSWSIRYRL